MSILFQNKVSDKAPIKQPFTPHYSEVESVEVVNNANTNNATTVNANTENVKADNGNFNSLLNHITTPRPKVEVNPSLKPKKDKEVKDNLDNDIVDDDDETTTNEKGETLEKSSPAFYKLRGKAAAELTDFVVPKGLCFLNNEEDTGKYKADAEGKQVVTDAYARYFAERKKPRTPFEELRDALLSVYSPAVVQSLYNKGVSIANEYKKNKIKEKELQIELLRQQQQAKNPQQTVQPQQQTTAQPEQTTVKEPIKQEPKQEPKQELKTCLHDDCNRTFEKGKGHAKGQRAKYYDKFCSASCMGKFTSLQALNNRKAIREKDNKNE